MNIKTLGWLLGAAALASSASIAACSQAQVQCQAGHAGSGVGFAVKYYPVGTPGAACAVPGDEIGFETYHPPGGGDDGSQPDFSVASIVAFQNNSMGVLIGDKSGVGSEDPEGAGKQAEDGSHIAPKHAAYSLGKFATVEPVNDFCAVTDPQPAEQDFPLVPKRAPDPADPMDMGDPEVPASTVKYAWSDVKVYVTAAAQGTQFSGRLKYTQDSCSAEYNVAGVWPSVACTSRVPDGVDANGDPKTKLVANAALCCPTADPLGGRLTGSGINPDFPMKCEQIAPVDEDNDDLGVRCVLDTADPSKLPILNPGWEANAAVCKTTAATQ